MRRVLVLGGTRFVGRRIVERLHERGDEVLVVHRGRSEPQNWVDVQHLHTDRADLHRHRQRLSSFAADAVVDSFALCTADVSAVLAVLPDVPVVVLSSQDVYRAFEGMSRSLRRRSRRFLRLEPSYEADLVDGSKGAGCRRATGLSPPAIRSVRSASSTGMSSPRIDHSRRPAATGALQCEKPARSDPSIQSTSVATTSCGPSSPCPQPSHAERCADRERPQPSQEGRKCRHFPRRATAGRLAPRSHCILTLVNGYARFTATPEYPHGMPSPQMTEVLRSIHTPGAQPVRDVLEWRIQWPRTHGFATGGRPSDAGAQPHARPPRCTTGS